MKYKKIAVTVFILTCLAQLFVPAKMIFDREDILNSGTEYKFRTEPLDPNDPFRGKYITLRYTDNVFPVDSPGYWADKGEIYVQLKKDEDGFAIIENIWEEAPDKGDYVIAKVSRNIAASTLFDPTHKKSITIQYPFNRFYMEEYKAPDAEKTYREAARDTGQTTYALVNIKDGEAVLKDVMIDGKSIKDIVKELDF